MLPSISTNIDDLILDNGEVANTKTFGINMRENTIVGTIDELDALKQSVYLMLSIEADQHIIYPYTYGINTLDLIGKPYYYVVGVIPERIKETLMSDDRILDVTDFEFKIDKNKLNVKFVVHTIYGEVNAEKVVTY